MEEKDAAINKILTEQIQKEQDERNKAYENSLGRIVNYEKVRENATDLEIESLFESLFRNCCQNA